MSNSSVSKSRLKVLRSSADLQSYDSEFQTDGALTQNAFADNASGIRSTASNSLSADRKVRLRLNIKWYMQFIAHMFLYAVCPRIGIHRRVYLGGLCTQAAPLEVPKNFVLIFNVRKKLMLNFEHFWRFTPEM